MTPINLSPSNRIDTKLNQFWEVLENDGLLITKRAKVPGGWLVQQFFCAPINRDNSIPGAMQFISDPYHEWFLKREYAA